MFEKLKALFGRKKAEQPTADQKRAESNPRPTYATPAASPLARSPFPARRANESETRRDDSSDLLNPMNPLGLTSPINPLNTAWHGSSAPSGSSDCGSSSSSYDSGTSSSSYDSGSSSGSCDSSSSW